MSERKDARRNREQLLASGEQIFREHGLQAPLQWIADQAGVGRGTLYRHFPDRDHLILAMVLRRIEFIEEHLIASPDSVQSLEKTFEWIVDTLSAIPGLHSHLTSTTTGLATSRELMERLRNLLAQPIQEAHRVGVLREGVSFEDFVTCWAMIEGSLLTIPTENRSKMAERAKKLAHAALFV